MSVFSTLDPKLSPLENLRLAVDSFHGVLSELSTAAPNIEALRALAGLGPGIRTLGACLSTEDCHVLFRSSGALLLLCKVVALASAAVVDVSRARFQAPTATPLPTDEWLSGYQAAVLTLAATAETRTNRAVIVASGACARLCDVAVAVGLSVSPSEKQPPFRADSLDPTNGLAGVELRFLPAVWASIEVGVSVLGP